MTVKHVEEQCGAGALEHERCNVDEDDHLEGTEQHANQH